MIYSVTKSCLKFGFIAVNSLCRYITIPTEKQRKHPYLEGSQMLGIWPKWLKIGHNMHLFSLLGELFGALWVSKIQYRVQGGTTAYTLAGVLPTPRIVPSMSAMLQRDSKRSGWGGGGDRCRIRRTPADTGTWQKQNTAVTWRARLGVHSKLSSHRSQWRSQRTMATHPPPGTQQDRNGISPHSTHCQPPNAVGLASKLGCVLNSWGLLFPTSELMFALLQLAYWNTINHLVRLPSPCGTHLGLPAQHQHGRGETVFKGYFRVSRPGIFHPLLCSSFSQRSQEGPVLPPTNGRAVGGLEEEGQQLFNFAHMMCSTTKVIPACGDWQRFSLIQSKQLLVWLPSN